MKNLIMTLVLFLSGIITAQEVEPKFEIIDNKVKATYYYENGAVKEQGFYLDGKLHGTWVSYSVNGEKEAMGEYSLGHKTGKWFFWNANTLNEVDYSDSRIAEVKKWSNETLAKN